jgi:hypothetical protein
MTSKRVERFVREQGVARPCELTYMSTPDAGCRAAGLEPVEGPLKRGKCAWRYIFVSGRFQAWVTEEMDKIVPPYDESDSPAIQLESEFSGFRNGDGLAYDRDMHTLDPRHLWVWELKTPDLRIFGWFPAKNYFVAHLGENKANLVKWDAYKPYVDEVVAYRTGLARHLPDFVEGGSSHVVSNRT